MAHLALYREFRPKTFDDVVSQHHIVETLKNQIESGNISHAYLFCGTRGTGKTSCAKIFARAVNCLSPKNGSPCGECEVCKKLQSNANLDIIEIDAASNNRVDEIRDLREKVNYLPTISKYKVYIIDEVHMLTDSAFNALLKTLEEPPEHIIFILATTEPDKLPATILSRCMRFDFKLLTVSELKNHLKNVFDKTGTTYDDKSLEIIAKAGKGSVRDTLSVAELCKSFANGKITHTLVEECLGAIGDEVIFNLANQIVTKNGGEILKQIDTLYQKGKNLTTLLSDLCDFFKDILYFKLTGKTDSDAIKDNIEIYSQISSGCDEKYLLDILKKLSESLSQIKLTSNEKIFAETTLLGLFYNDNLEIEMLKQKVDMLMSGEKIISTTPAVAKQQTSVSSAGSQTALSPKSIFGEIISFVRTSGNMMLYAGLGDISSVDIVDNIFVFHCKTNTIKNLLEEHKNLLTNMLKEKYNFSGIKADLLQEEKPVDVAGLGDMLNGKLKVE